MQRRKGFTLVELVIVIAVIAILAGVLIGTFASVINRANESARMQELKAQEIEQKAEDILKKIEDSNWYGWEDFEASLVAKMTEAYKKNSTASITEETIQKVVKKALDEFATSQASQHTSLTAEQVKAIVENAIGGINFNGVTEAQVRAIVGTATSSVLANQLTVSQIRTIINAANENNLTANDLAKALASLPSNTTIANLETNVTSAINGLVAQMLTEEQVANVLKALVPVTETAEDADDAKQLFKDLVSGSTIILGDGVTGELNFTLTDTETKTIIIANNSATSYADKVTIKGARATVYLIGDFDEVVAEKVDTNSLHVLGKVTLLTVKQGRAVVESGASVSTLTAMPNENATVVVVVEESAVVTDLNAQYQDHGYAQGNRDYIEIENNGEVGGTNITASAALVTSKTTTTNVVIKNGRGSTGSTVEEISVDTNVGSFDVTVDDTDAIANADTQKVEVALFAGGTGTAQDPYLIATAKQMQNITLNYNNTEAYYKIKTGVEYIECSNWTPVNLYGNFDGNGVKFVNLDNYLFDTLNANGTSKVSNFEVNCNITGLYFAAVIKQTRSTSIELNSINVKGYIEGNCAAPFLALGANYTLGSNDSTYTFVNCEASCTLVATGETAAGFMCHICFDSGSNNIIYIDNSKFVGNMSCIKNSFKFFCTNSNKGTVSIYVKGDIGSSKLGSAYTISSDTDENGFAAILKNNNVATDAYAYAPYSDATSTSLITNVTGTLPAVGETFTVDKSGDATYAVATLVIGPNDKKETGNYTGIYLTERLELVNDKFTTITVKNYDVVVNGDEAYETGINGTVYNIVNAQYGTTYGSAVVRIIQYTANGTITCITTYNIKR